MSKHLLIYIRLIYFTHETSNPYSFTTHITQIKINSSSFKRVLLHVFQILRNINLNKYVKRWKLLFFENFSVIKSTFSRLVNIFQIYVLQHLTFQNFYVMNFIAARGYISNADECKSLMQIINWNHAKF